MRRSTGRLENHMNTMGWKISNKHYAKWKKMWENLLKHLKLALFQ